MALVLTLMMVMSLVLKPMITMSADDDDWYSRLMIIMTINL